jgi:hypothetical protein
MKTMINEDDKLAASTAPADERLGNLLSASLPGNRNTACPDDGELAALVDGSLESPEKDKLIDHLSSCAACRETYLLAVHLNEDAGNERGKEKNKLILFRPLAAAATILIAAVAMYLFFQSSEIPKSAEQLVKMQESAEDSPFRQSAPAPPAPGKDAPKEERVKREPQSAPVQEKSGKKAAEKEEFLDSFGAVKQDKAREETKVKRVHKVAGAPAELKQQPVDDSRAMPPAPGTRKGIIAETAREAAPLHDVSLKEPESSFFPRVNRLKTRYRPFKSYIPPRELDKLFSETFQLSKELGRAYEQVRKEAIKSGDYRRIDALARNAAPLITVTTGRESGYIYPNMGFFVSKSSPGSAVHRFFRLACSGWCDASGICFGLFPDENTLAEWRALHPQLTGIYKEIAASTIRRLEAD